MTFRTRLFWAGSAFSAVVSAQSLALAADYYFDTDKGSDDNNGSTEATPKKTFKMPSGTGTINVYIKRGSVIQGNLSAGGYGSTGTSSISVKAYGCGLRPVVNGTVSVNGATVEGINAKPTNGVGFQVSSNSTLRDCETDGINDLPTNSAGCMGITINGTNNHVTGCYIHDFGFSSSGSSVNNSGGAEGIMVMGSNNEISYCSVVNSYSSNKTLGGFEGGCYEIVNGKPGTTLSNISFHHNYCGRSVGLFEVSTGNFSNDAGGAQTNHGIVENVTVSYNVSVDSMWLFLLQSVNTDFKNVVFANNTIIHTAASKDYWTIPVSTDFPQGQAYNGGGHAAMALAYDTDTFTDPNTGTKTTYEAENEFYSKKGTGFQPGTVIVRNNIFVDDIGAKDMMFSAKLSDHSNNIFVPSTASVGGLTLDATEKKVDLAALAFGSDYQLTAGSTPAIDQGVLVSMNTTPMLASAAADPAFFGAVFTQDVARQAVPCGSAPDIGASEYCNTAAILTWPGASSNDSCGAGGASTAGGATSVSTGGVSAGTGGSSAGPTAGAATTGGKSSAVVATGGAAVVNAGGTANVGGKANAGGATLVVGAGGSTVIAATGGSGIVVSVGGASPTATGGAGPANTADTTVVVSVGGQTANTSGGANAGAPAGTGTVQSVASVADQGGCSCSTAGSKRSGLSTALASLGLAVLAMGRRRKQARR